MTDLSIGQFTAIELSPEAYLQLAAQTGCSHASLLASSPNPRLPLPLATEDNLPAIRQALRDTGLRISNIECLMLTPDTRLENFRPALAIGREVGALGVTALLFDTDEQRVRTNLHALCELAGEYGLRVSIEFMPLTPAWKTLEATAELIRQVDHPDLGLCIDLLHLMRSGGSPADLASVPAALIHYVQLCDSEDDRVRDDYGVEAGTHRLAPGAGCFPVEAFIRALPDSALLEIEVPQPAERPAAERVAEIAAATRRVVAQAHG